jgi:hypothetical protein
MDYTFSSLVNDVTVVVFLLGRVGGGKQAAGNLGVDGVSAAKTPNRVLEVMLLAMVSLWVHGMAQRFLGKSPALRCLRLWYLWVS